MAYASEIRTMTTGLRGRFAALLNTLAEERAQRALYRRTLNELQMLNQRELDDLGISAHQIPFIAREAAYGRA